MTDESNQRATSANEIRGNVYIYEWLNQGPLPDFICEDAPLWTNSCERWKENTFKACNHAKIAEQDNVHPTNKITYRDHTERNVVWRLRSRARIKSMLFRDVFWPSLDEHITSGLYSKSKSSTEELNELWDTTKAKSWFKYTPKI